MLGNVKQFYGNLKIHFGEPKLPKDAKLEDFIANFVQDLDGFSDRVYDLAAKKLRTDPNATRSFPTNGVILKTVQEIHQDLAVDGPPPPPKPKYPEWAQDAIAEANRLICSDIGRRAAAEGWIIGLWDFCRENRRWPNAPEANHVKAKSLATWRELKEFEDNPETVAGALVLINTFKAKRNKLAGIARGKIAA